MLTFDYDGTSSSSYINVITNVKKTLTPEDIVRNVYIPGKEGKYFFDRNFGKREIEIDVLLIGTSQSDLINKINNLNGFLYKDEPKQLVFSDESDKHFNALFLNANSTINRRVWHATMSLKFECFDPFLYTTTADNNNQNCTTKPSIIPINNQGNYYAYPIWVITFNQAQTYIVMYYHDGSNYVDRFDMTRSFTATDKLKIDTKNKIIYYDNGSGYTEDWTGFGTGGNARADFIKLQVGNKNYGINTTDATLNVNVEWTFNKTYL